MQQAGILAGKTNNRFDPAGTATRAEVATVLRRFVEIIIDPQAANGWQQNDSGQWSYYRNGEPVKGWLSENQKWYWLDKVTGVMFAGGWKQIDGTWYYFNEYGHGKHHHRRIYHRLGWCKKVTYNKKDLPVYQRTKINAVGYQETPPRLFFLLFFSGVQHFINQGK